MALSHDKQRFHQVVGAGVVDFFSLFGKCFPVKKRSCILLSCTNIGFYNAKLDF